MKQVCAVVNTNSPYSPVGFNFDVIVSLDGADGGMRTHSRIIMHHISSLC